jgi:tryptophan synthase beta chain
VGPEHAWLAGLGRAEYVPVTDDQAMQSLRLLSRTEGIIPAIETAHALAGTQMLGQELGPDATILVSLSGRGDKDMETAGRYFGLFEPGSGL